MFQFDEDEVDGCQIWEYMRAFSGAAHGHYSEDLSEVR